MAERAGSESNVQKAVAFFIEAGLSRLVEKLRDRYIELGRVGGQALLEQSTARERRELASLLGKPPYRTADINVRLAEVDRALRASGWACTLPDLLAAFFPDTPLVTRPDQRAARALQQADFRTSLLSIAQALPEESRARHWLLNGQHGLNWLFARNKNEPVRVQEAQLQLVRAVVQALDQLPPIHAPQRLAVFAQRISGDPHCFDAGQPAGRLLRYALAELDSDSGSRESIFDLYLRAGLLIDTISSSVAVCNLASALDQQSQPDPFVPAAGTRVLLLSLRQLLEWKEVTPATADIYIFENPQVFEEVIARATTNNPLPAMVCTSGWPSAAALLLLDRLIARSSSVRLHYSGDFDLSGLRIAAYLLERYPERCFPWRFDPASYEHALRDEGTAASQSDLSALEALPGTFAPLVDAIRAAGTWAYQEGIVDVLADDIVA